MEHVDIVEHEQNTIEYFAHIRRKEMLNKLQHDHAALFPSETGVFGNFSLVRKLNPDLCEGYTTVTFTRGLLHSLVPQSSACSENISHDRSAAQNDNFKVLATFNACFMSEDVSNIATATSRPSTWNGILEPANSSSARILI